MSRVIITDQPHGVPAEGIDAWQFCVGTGRLSLALRKDWLDSLSLVQQVIGFRYVRGHGLFHDDIGIFQPYEWQGECRIAYNFTYLDQIFDSLLERGIRPFLELGFMPHELASGNQTVFWWQGNVTPPRDHDQWCALVEATLRHCIERYGSEEVRTWPVEVWNEPNLTNFWEGADQAAYFELYRRTAFTVKGVDPELQVGGPAICGGSDHWMSDFLAYCREHHVPVDFLSRHAYTSSPAELVPFSCYQDLAPVEQLLADFATGRKHCAAQGVDLPVHITEFNTSYKPVNPVHDTCYNAAYLGRALSEGGDLVESFSYWTFSDMFEEEGVPQAPFHGGFGLLTHRQVKKPTFHLYAFFARLGEHLLHRDAHCQVRRDDEGTVGLVAWNPVADANDPDPTLRLSLALPLPDGPVLVRRQRVDEQSGNPWGVWVGLGRPRFPSEAEWQLLRGLSEPREEWWVTTSVDGQVEVDLQLNRNEVTWLEARPVHDQTGDYPGLDDHRIPGY